MSGAQSNNDRRSWRPGNEGRFEAYRCPNHEKKPDVAPLSLTASHPLRRRNTPTDGRVPNLTAGWPIWSRDGQFVYFANSSILPIRLFCQFVYFDGVGANGMGSWYRLRVRDGVLERLANFEGLAP